MPTFDTDPRIRTRAQTPYWRNVAPAYSKRGAKSYSYAQPAQIKLIQELVRTLPMTSAMSKLEGQRKVAGQSQPPRRLRSWPKCREPISKETPTKVCVPPHIFLESKKSSFQRKHDIKHQATDKANVTAKVTAKVKKEASTEGSKKSTPRSKEPAVRKNTSVKRQSPTKASLAQDQAKEYEKIPAAPRRVSEVSNSSKMSKTKDPIKKVVEMEEEKESEETEKQKKKEEENKEEGNKEEENKEEESKEEKQEEEKEANAMSADDTETVQKDKQDNIETCLPNMKVFPCFRGEYPTRHRPGTFQWFQRSGPKGAQLLAMSEETEPITGEGKIITSCEVTEAHFLSIDCDDDNHPRGMGPPCNQCKTQMWTQTNDNNGATFMNSYPVAGGPEQLPCNPCNCPHLQQQQQFNLQSQQRFPCQPTSCFSFHQQQRQNRQQQPGNDNENGNGLTEMLAQQLQQQMQQAQAQIAQVQMLLNSACGATRVRKLQVLSNSFNHDMENGPEPRSENPDYTDNDLESCGCPSVHFANTDHVEQPVTPQRTPGPQFLFPFPICNPSPPFQSGFFSTPAHTTDQQQQQQPSFVPSCLCQSQQTRTSPQSSFHQASLQQNQTSQQSMRAHGNHFCPGCCRQRYAQMRFMMPRCWPR